MTLNDLQNLQYAVKALEEATMQFIRKAPQFSGDEELASVIGYQMGSVQTWVENKVRDYRSGRES